ncbi:putative transport protein [Yarrowia sp. C11]|nr:putative transport protein [Yarrowia sp. C11]
MTVKRLGKHLLTQFEALTKGYTGMLMALMSSFFSSGMAVTARLLQNSNNPEDNFNPFQILFLRMTLTIGIVLWVQHKVYARKQRQQKEATSQGQVPEPLPSRIHFITGIPEVRHLLVIRALCGFFGVFGLYYSLNYLELSDATVLTFLTPVATSLLAWMFLGEKFTRSMAMGGLVAFCGVILIARPVFLFQLITGSHDTSGVRPIDRLRSIGFSMLGVLGGGSAFVAIRSIGDRAHPTVNVQYFSTWCWFISLVALVYTGKGIRLPHTWSQAAFIIILALCGFMTQLCMTGALTREKAAKVANITYTQIVWALLWDKVLWNNWPDVWSVLGGGLIIGSAIWVAMKKDVTVATVNDIAEVVPSTPQLDEYHVDSSYYSPDEEAAVGMPLTPISKREAKVTIKSTGNDDDHLRLDEEDDKEEKEDEDDDEDAGEDVGLMHKLK